VGQQPAEVDKQTVDQNEVRDTEGSRSSHLEDKSNDYERERDAPRQYQEFAEIADQNLNQNKDNVDAGTANCEDKSNNHEVERNTPMESEDSYRGELYDYLILFLKLLFLPDQVTPPVPPPPPPPKKRSGYCSPHTTNKNNIDQATCSQLTANMLVPKKLPLTIGLFIG